MIRLSFDLPKKRRLDLHLVKRRKAPLEKPLIPNMGEVLRARKGSRVSRFFRHIFEHKRIKKVLGTNIALIIIASSFVPTEANFDVEPDKTVIIQETTPQARP